MNAADILEPLGDRVLLRKDPVSRNLGSGLVAPATARLLPASGTVLKCGPDAGWLKPGDRIVFGRYSTSPLGLDGQGGDEIACICASEIFAIHEPS